MAVSTILGDKIIQYTIEQDYADWMRLVKRGHSAALDINGLKNLPAGSTTICRTPEDFLPCVTPVYQDFHILRSADVNIRVYIGDPYISIYNYGSAITSNSNTRFYLSYVSY